MKVKKLVVTYQIVSFVKDDYTVAQINIHRLSGCRVHNVVVRQKYYICI